jgi:hypothetical protein
MRVLGSIRGVAMATAVWVLVGVPVAAVISALQLFLFVVLAVPEMAETAFVLGVVHGLWLQLAGRSPESKARDVRLRGVISGGVLGLLAFPPVFSRAYITPVNVSAAVTFVTAAIVGGITAGVASAAVVTVPLRPLGSTLSRNVVFGCLFILPLMAIDYHFYWTGTVDRLPIQEVSQREIASLASGDARGSSWAGCYHFWGHYPLNTGGENGLLTVAETDGALQVVVGFEHTKLAGRVDSDGSFRFGGESTVAQDTLLNLWEGTFHNNSLTFMRRSTLLSNGRVVNTMKTTGAAQRTACPGPVQ